MGIIRSNINEKKSTIDESEVDRLDRMLSEIDQDVIQYLHDPKNVPHPGFERLIAQIQALPERKDVSKTLTLKIANLKYKAYYYERSWRQISENVKQAAKGKKEFERRKETYLCAPEAETKQPLEQQKGTKPKRVDMLYQYQTKKCAEHEIKPPETKEMFRARIMSQYKTIQNQSGGSQKLVLAWNKTEKRCDLIIDRREKSKK